VFDLSIFGIEFVSFYDFSIWFWRCYDREIFVLFYVNTLRREKQSVSPFSLYFVYIVNNLLVFVFMHCPASEIKNELIKKRKREKAPSCFHTKGQKQHNHEHEFNSWLQNKEKVYLFIKHAYFLLCTNN
jgi:hypothetical protein